VPIYEYRCANCGFEKEYLQKLSDAPLKDCPECGQPAFCKQVSAAGFQLKGSGWYATDFKNNQKSKPAPESTTKPAAESGSKEKSAESAPAPESKAKSGESKPATPAPAKTN